MEVHKLNSVQKTKKKKEREELQSESATVARADPSRTIATFDIDAVLM